MSEESLYRETDPVHVMTDGNFFYEDGKGVINEDDFAGAGVLKAYAMWCPQCTGKVKCINILATLLKEEDLAVYVINLSNKPGDNVNLHFSETLKIESFPTFFKVNEYGVVSERLKTGTGQDVGTVPDIIVALCDNANYIRKYADKLARKNSLLNTLKENGC